MQTAILKALEAYARKLFNDPTLIASVVDSKLKYGNEAWKQFLLRKGTNDFVFFHFRADAMRDTTEFVRICKLTIQEIYKLHKETKSK